MELQEFSPSLEPAEWDFYRVTVKERQWNADLWSALVDQLRPTDFEEGKGYYGYEKGLRLLRDGDRILTLYTGGNEGTRCLEASGYSSPELVTLLRSLGVQYRPSRLDACLDYDEEGLADALFDFAVWFANKKGLKLDYRGDWDRRKERTLYVGSRASAVFLRIYEKGHQAIAQGDQDASPHWVRIEVECKPDKKRREHYALLEPSDLFRAGWVAEFMGDMFVQELAREPIGYQRVKTTDAMQKRWLVKVGRRIMSKWMQDFETPEQWGRAMAELIEEVPVDDCE